LPVDFRDFRSLGDAKMLNILWIKNAMLNAANVINHDKANNLKTILSVMLKGR
jgi:hypothetical protein